MMLNKLALCLVLVSTFHLGSGQNQKNSTETEDSKERNGKGDLKISFKQILILYFKDIF